jgi:hypothetical protein
LIGRGWELGDDAAGFFGELAGAVLGSLDSMMLVEELQNFAEWDLIVIAVGEDGLYQFALFGVGGFERVDQGSVTFPSRRSLPTGLPRIFSREVKSRISSIS